MRIFFGLMATFLAASIAASARGQAMVPQAADLSAYAKTTDLPAAVVANAPVKSVNTNTGVVTVAVYTDAQAVAAAQTGLASLTNLNIQMGSGTFLVHALYQSRNNATASTTSETTAFGAGDGSLTIQPSSMYVGARFRAHFAGRGQTGLASVTTDTARLKLGATTLVTGATVAFPASTAAIPFWADVVCTIRSIGVSGTMMCSGALGYVAGLSSAAPLLTDLSMTAAATINTTTALTWDATNQLSSVIGTPTMAVVDAYVVQEN